MRNLNDELEGMRGESYFLSIHYVDSTNFKIGMAYFKVLSPYSSASTDRKLQ